MLSIIIPFYGTADKWLLNRCIKSIEKQYLPADSYEVIVVDDEGKGLGGARNIGIGKAKGEYLMFVDADDYLFSNALSSLVHLLQKYQPDMLSFGFQKVKDDTALISANGNHSYSIFELGATYLLSHNFMGTAWRHLLRRQWILKHHLLFAESVYHEDEAFVAKAYCLAGKTIISNEVVYAYSQSSYSILHNVEKEQRQRRINDFEKLLVDLQQFDEMELSSLQHEALQRRLHFLTIDYLIQMWRNCCSIVEARAYISYLKEMNLLPLPKANYSFKYRLAQTFINLFS